MTDEMLLRCELFAKNLNMMREKFRWEASHLYALCANIYTNKGIELEPERIKTSKEIIKDSTSFFSNFRNTTTTTALATIISMEPEPANTFLLVKAVYGFLKEFFTASASLTLAAYLIVSNSPADKYAEVITHSRKIFDLMKKKHFFLTSSGECITAVQFALLNKNDEEVISRSEKCFELLKAEMGNGNTNQAISNVLALKNAPENEMAEKTVSIINSLKSHGYKITSGLELSVFAALSILDNSVESAVNDTLEVNAYLMTVQGFGNAITGSKLIDPKLLPKRRLMHSALIVLNEYVKRILDSDAYDEDTKKTVSAAEIMATINMIISLGPANV